MATLTAMDAAIQVLLSQPVEPFHKGMPVLDRPLRLGEVGSQGWNALEGDIPWPAMVLKESAVAGNIELMAAFCREHGLELAPHGKTTMSPQLAHRQLGAGAWGITVATASQAALFRRFGVPRLILANQLLDPAGVRWVAHALGDDPSFDLFCLVDSVAGVERLDYLLAQAGAAPTIKVLIELGVSGKRAGCRTSDQIDRVAAAVDRAEGLTLAGLEAFEGVIGATRDAGTVARVRSFLDWVKQEAERLMEAGRFPEGDRVVVTIGGSAYPDLVAHTLGRAWTPPQPAMVVLRSGCYVTHDHGLYAAASPFGDRAEPGGQRLVPALEIWGVVLSRPEPELAIVGFGKRDVPYDAGLPVPIATSAPGEPVTPIPTGVEVTGLNDQHAMLRVPADAPLTVGRLIGCGISHPCTAFDKWALIPLVDDGYRVVGAVRCYF